MNMLQKAEMAVKSRPNQLPSLEPLSKMPGKLPLKVGGGGGVFETNKPIKIL